MFEDGDIQHDSDGEFEKPKDEFMFYFKAFKLEEKKIVQHQKFEEITGQYWQLLRNDPDCDISQPLILQPLYSKFMKCVYKALLPLYKEGEMSSEIQQEWLQDCRGQNGLNFQLVTKLLFRIAHQWATHIDLEEYIDLLHKIFLRISQLTNYLTSGFSLSDQKYIVDFPQEEKKMKENEGKNDRLAQYDEWLECRSDESNRSEYEYKYEEDPDNMMVKKYKKAKLDGNGQAVGALTTIKEPFVYSEEIIYSTEDGINYYSLRSVEQVIPFGFPTEQFICQLKNDVYYDLQQLKEENKQEIMRLKRLAREQGIEVDLSKYQNEEDPGLIENPTSEVKQREYYINLPSSQGLSLTIVVNISDQLYNTFRQMLRDAQNLALRIHSIFPKAGAKSKSRSALQNNEPILEFNKFGYNPALERRVCYKLAPVVDEGQPQRFVNIHYLIWNQHHHVAYRSDVQKVESKGKMSIKESEEIRKPEEFINVETSYKVLREIMLSKKFGSIFSDRSAADIKEQKRIKKIIEKEERRKQVLMKPGMLASKGLSETYEEKSFIKMMRGPFFQLQSKEGMKDDEFVYCSENDIIEAAQAQVLRILIIGKPRSGKTTLAKNISLKNNLDLVHINVDNWIAALLDKIKNYEPPEDLEEGQEPPKFLSDLEQSIQQSLKEGLGPKDDDIIEIIKLQINSPQAKTRGYVVDLHFYSRYQSWASTIRQQGLLPIIEGVQQEFSHIVELMIEDEEIKLRAQQMRVNPIDNVVYSRWEREERKKPKIIPEGEEEPVEDEENQIKPLDESSLIHRIQDQEHRIREEITYYNTIERPAIEELCMSLYDNQYIKVDCAGLIPDEMMNCVLCKLKPDRDLPLRPIAQQIEGGNDFKSLLSEGIEENQIPRKWSIYKQIDPVALYQGKLVQGSPEFAASFYNNVFTFVSEENMKSFILEPKIYINKRPSMPKEYRTLMLGPQGAGKHTQAEFLSNLFGWKIVDFKQMVRQKLDELFKFEIHIPNNPMPGGRIGLSEHELQEISEGKPFPAWKFIPWIFEYLGFELEKKRPPPPEQKEGEEQVEEEELSEEEIKKRKEVEAKKKKEEEEKKRKEEEEKNKIKEERRRRRQEAIDQGLDLAELGLENEDEEIIIIEDLNADQLALKIDEVTLKAPFVGGFILIGYPETEEQFIKLKEYGLEFDRVIYLQDTNEDDPGKEIKERMVEVINYDYDWEVENAQKVLALAKDQLGEDIVREISCNGVKDDVFIRIRNDIDPFYLKIDNPDDVRVTADLSDEDKRLPKGDFGDFCPVTYIKDNWLVRGNQEMEVTIGGKTYWPAGEKEAEEFKFNPTKFLSAQNGLITLPLEAPPPKIMVVGHKGAGVSTLIQNLCNKFKLEEFNLKDAFLKKLKEEKEKRKRTRLLERGFKAPLPPEEEGLEPPPDPEIEDDPEDFDKALHEREVMRTIIDASIGYVIDGTWSDLPEDSVSQSLHELLFESRRVPEIVIMLKCKEKSTFDRIIDYQSIQNEFDALMLKRDEERKRVRDEDRLRKLEEVMAIPDDEKTQEEKDEEIAKWDEDRDAEDEAADENDPEKPNLDEMKEKFREDLRQRREKDDAFMEEFGIQLKEKLVYVIDEIRADISASFVFLKILDRIKDHFQFRKDLIDRQLAQPLKSEEVKFYEQSYNWKYSKFGLNSPINLSNPEKSKKFAVLYRERIYFLANKEEQQAFLKEPSKYAFSDTTIPLDLLYKPRISVIGYSKVGKSTLCKKLSDKIGVIHLHMPDIIQSFLEKDSQYFENLRRIIQVEGKQLDDDVLVNLLLKRIQFEDCQRNGWVLEDFPKTRNQALFLAKKGIVPTNIFNLKISQNVIIERNQQRDTMKFGSKEQVMLSRIRYLDNNLPNMLSFYMKFYNNVHEIDMTKSKWYVEDRALRDIRNNLEARQAFARDYYLNNSYPQPCQMKFLHMDKCLTKQAISDFKYYCPVSWRNEKILVNCSENFEDTLLYKNNFYFFKSQKERDMFYSNPERFLMNSNFPRLNQVPIRVMPHKAAEILSFEKGLIGHCPSTLIDEERVQKGDQMLVVVYRDIKFTFDNEFKLQRFVTNPFKYSKAVLPVKMPPNQDKINLYNLSKMEDSITFMEQSLGQVVTRALREISENRLKYPTLSVKETMLKLFALYLKTHNPANTQFMMKKYEGKLKQFIQRCELPEEIYDLGQERGKFIYCSIFIEKHLAKGHKEGWQKFKEDYYNLIGSNYDSILNQIHHEKLENFISYIR